jgi:hypothetical protein
MKRLWPISMVSLNVWRAGLGSRDMMIRFLSQLRATTPLRLAVGFFFAGLAWRILFCLVLVPAWEASSRMAPSADAYDVLARSLLERHEFGYAPFGASPTTVRGPAFPVWLAAGMVVLGHGGRLLGLWGGLPGLAVGALIAWLAARSFGLLAGVVAGAVALLHPLPSLNACRILSDDFYAALGCVSLVAWYLALRSGLRTRRGYRWALVAAILLGVHMLSRSTGLLTLFAVLVHGASLRWRPFRKYALLVTVALLLPLLWSVRASRLEGRPVFVHSLLAYNFWVGEAFEVYGAGPPPAGNWGEILDYARARAGPAAPDPSGFWYGALDPHDLARFDSELGRAAIRHVAQDPLGYLGRVMRGLGRFWFQAQTARRSLQYLAAVLTMLFLACVGGYGVLRPGATDATLGKLFLLTIMLHNVAYAAVFPMARFSVQVYPEVAYLAGAGVAQLHELRASRRIFAGSRPGPAS